MTETANRARDWRYWLGTLGAFVLGVVLLVAAWAKALDPASFAELIRTEGLDIVFSGEIWALLMIVAEAALGLALVLNLRRGWVLLPAALMVALFVFLNARTYWQFSQGILDESSPCGCFGNLVDRTPGEAFWQDLLLLVPPLLLSWLGRPMVIVREKLRIAVVVVVGLVATWFVWKAPELPLDDLATRLKPGVGIGEFCAGRDTEDTVRICLDTLMPELQVGRHIVVLATLDNEELLTGVDALSAAADAGGPSVWLLTDSLEQERRDFYWQWAPVFETREVPLALIRPLYRTQPRSFELESGIVTKTWSGLPPVARTE